MVHPTATESLTKIRDHEQLPSQLLDTYLTRLQQREPAIQAWTSLAIAPARDQAIALDQQLRDHPPDELLSARPLWGIPIGVKDIFSTVDMPTGWGFPLYDGRYLTEDAAVVSRLKAAGAIILGKTVTTELATAAPGPTANPHNLHHSPGGSSSGSAAAVADGMVPIAIGSQTMGSVLRPAAYCGIFGFKPSFGLIARTGMMSVASELDQVGIFANCIDDVRLVFDGLLNPEHSLPEDTEKSLLQGSSLPRLAWIKTPHWHDVEPVTQARLQQVVDAISQAGTIIHPVELSARCTDYWDTIQTLCAHGLYQHHGGLMANYPSRCSPKLKEWMMRGQGIDASTYARAVAKQKQYQVDVDAILSNYDAIFTPVTSGPAPLGLENTGSPLFCGLWTLCGLPALNIPVGKTSEGLPLGCQLVGRRNHDRQLLQIAQYCWSPIQSRFGGVEVPGASVQYG